MSTSPVRSFKRAQNSPISLIGKLHDDVHRTEVVDEVTIIVPIQSFVECVDCESDGACDLL